MDDLNLLKTRQEQEMESYYRLTQNEQLYENNAYMDTTRSEQFKEKLVRGEEFQDTAKLGKTVFKVKNDAQKTYNKRINESKKLTDKATAYTLETYDTVRAIHKNNFYGDHGPGKRELDEDTMVYRILTYHFTPAMFSSANIRANLAEYVALVKSYEEIKITDEASENPKLSSVKEIMDLFSKRIHVYLEQNRVDINGNILQEYTKPKSLDPSDIMEWESLLAEKEITEETQEPETREKLLTDIVDINEMIARHEESLHNFDNENFMRYMSRASEEAKQHHMQVLLRLKNSLIVLNGRLLNTRIKIQILDEKEKTDINEDQKKANIANLEQMLKENETDLQRLLDRDLKRSIGDITVRNTKHPALYQVSRVEATSTESELKLKEAKDQWKTLAFRLQEFNKSHRQDLGDIAWAFFNLEMKVNDYASFSHYNSTERKNEKNMLFSIQMCMDDIEKRLNQITSEGALQLYNEVKAKFKDLTTGSKKFPDFDHLPQVMKIDASHGNIEETGDEEAKHLPGYYRTSFMNNDATRYWESERISPLFEHEPSVNDLRQGKVSNCYMVAGTCGIINLDPQIIKDAIHDNGDGTVTVRLFKENMRQRVYPVYIKVTKEIPKTIFMGDVLSSGALWMQLIEKAAAAMGRNPDDTGYHTLWKGEGGDWVFRLTGKKKEVVFAKNERGDMPRFQSQLHPGTTIDHYTEEGKTMLFNEILHARENNTVYNCGTGSDVNDGLNSGHAYTVIGAKVVSGEKYIILRNPYANMSMRYEDYDSAYMKNGKFFSFLSSTVGETCGVFAITLDDFVSNMQTVTKTKLDDRFVENENEAQRMQELATLGATVTQEDFQAAIAQDRLADDMDL